MIDSHQASTCYTNQPIDRFEANLIVLFKKGLFSIVQSSEMKQSVIENF